MIAAVLSYILGMSKAKTTDLVIEMPVKGKMISLDQVADETFANEKMGKGYAIIPNDQYIYAPCDGTIVVLAQTKHALGIQTKQGEELLIHIGIDTVEMDGEGFKSYVHVGDVVEEGTLLIEFDVEKIKNAGYETDVMVIITQLSQYSLIHKTEADELTIQDVILDIQ